MLQTTDTQSKNDEHSGAYYIGLMSGTSVDGLDLALCRIHADTLDLVNSLELNLPSHLKQALDSTCRSPEQHLATLGELDAAFGKFCAHAITQLLQEAKLAPSDIRAIGSHGQTIFHQPETEHCFSMQIGNGNLIAELSGIACVCDFRMADMAAGGQGAPLAPGFHNAVFRTDKETRAILNLGGIANITLLPSDSNQAVIGFDTGPANTLMDQWIKRHQQQNYDKDGHWARTGQVNDSLLNAMLSEPFFGQAAPKSTGRELFNMNWLDAKLAAYPGITPADVQRSLLELSAMSAANALQKASPQGAEPGAVYCCGGGAYNSFLLERLTQLLPAWQVGTTQALGMAPEWVEACAFAWLAHQRIAQRPGNLPSVTGARKSKILGCLYLP